VPPVNEETLSEDKVKITVWDFEIDKCHADWLPSYDSTVDIAATITPSGVSGTITFYLLSSHEPGFCMNATTEGTGDDDRDLQFLAGENSAFNVSEVPPIPYRYHAETKTEVNSATVTVHCYDYGAYVTMNADTSIGGKTKRAHIVDGTEPGTRIPRDGDGDHLPKKWEEDQVTAWNTQYGTSYTVDENFFSTSKDWERNDPDSPGPLGSHAATGDWFTAYNEFRGYVGTYSGDATQHRRLSAARKELLVEVDIMDIMSGSNDGKSTDTSDAKIANMLTDNDGGWTVDQLIHWKLRPDTGSNLWFHITDNTASTITIYGDMSIATDLGAPSTYEIAKWQPPSTATINSVMSSVETAFTSSAGVQLYWIIDDTSGNRVTWDSLSSVNAMSTWMSGCRDDGGQDEDEYGDFVHLGFIDWFSAADYRLATGAAWSPWEGCMVAVWTDQEAAKAFSAKGVTHNEAMAATATHEVGHTVTCDDHYTQHAYDAFEIEYTGAGQAATLDIGMADIGLSYLFFPAHFKTTVDAQDDIDYDVRSAAYDSLGEVVNAADGLADYTAGLNDGGNAGEHSFNMVAVEGADITNPYQVSARNDDYIMLGIFAADKANNIKFHQEWDECIPNMDVKNNYAQP